MFLLHFLFYFELFRHYFFYSCFFFPSPAVVVLLYTTCTVICSKKDAPNGEKQKSLSHFYLNYLISVLKSDSINQQDVGIFFLRPPIKRQGPRSLYSRYIEDVVITSGTEHPLSETVCENKLEELFCVIDFCRKYKYILTFLRKLPLCVTYLVPRPRHDGNVVDGIGKPST